MNTAITFILVLVALGFGFGMATFGANLRRMQRTVDRMETAAQLVAVDLANTAGELRKAARQRTALVETLDRMEGATVIVQEGRDTIAGNLADSVSRADATEGPEGAAADAALRTGDSAEAIHARQDQVSSPRLLIYPQRAERLPIYQQYRREWVESGEHVHELKDGSEAHLGGDPACPLA